MPLGRSHPKKCIKTLRRTVSRSIDHYMGGFVCFLVCFWGWCLMINDSVLCSDSLRLFGALQGPSGEKKLGIP